ncbi:MAG: hypothetical protein ACRD3W_25865, partial [Terriglobales bacterium]
MHNRNILNLSFLLAAFVWSCSQAAYAGFSASNNNDIPGTSLGDIETASLKQPQGQAKQKDSLPGNGVGGQDQRGQGGEAKSRTVNMGEIGGMYDKATPASKVNVENVPVGQAAQMVQQGKDLGLDKTGSEQVTDFGFYRLGQEIMRDGIADMTDPQNAVGPAKAAGQAQATDAGNSAAETERNQSASAIGWVQAYLTNFTVDPGNPWNVLRNRIFVPMALLLLLPGAVLAQVKAIIAAGSPVLGQINPFEGILRSIIAIFMIPGTYLIINYSIDVANSITFTINSEYFKTFGSDMYYDALCAEVRAFPAREPSENENAMDLPTAAMKPLLAPNALFAGIEGMMEGSYFDPKTGLKLAPKDRADEALPRSAVAARLAMNG